MIIRAVSLAALLTVSASGAFAKTCEQLAQDCLSRGGVPATCLDQQRMKICKSTGTYTAPDGKASPANKK